MLFRASNGRTSVKRQFFDHPSFPIHWKRFEIGEIPLKKETDHSNTPKRRKLNIDLVGYQAEVFVVEDNKVNQRVIAAILKKLNCKVSMANNGQEAVDKLKTGYVPDIILMDCQMPVLDGYEATKIIREEEHFSQSEPHTIVAITANAMIGDREKTLAAGMDDHLAKPITIASLGKKLKQYHIITMDEE